MSDFHLKPSSPCIDRGVVIPKINDGTGGSIRFLGLAPDLGLYEAPSTITTWLIPHAAMSQGTLRLQIDWVA